MHQTNALLAALETDPHDADALLAALRTPPLEGKFANVWPDTRDSARTLVNAAREALANDFAEPHPLSAGRAVAFMVDTYDWMIAGALRANPHWPNHGPWHQHCAAVALLHRPRRHVICGPAVTRLALDVLGRGYVYTHLHNPYEVRAASSLGDWAAHKRRQLPTNSN